MKWNKSFYFWEFFFIFPSFLHKSFFSFYSFFFFQVLHLFWRTKIYFLNKSFLFFIFFLSLFFFCRWHSLFFFLVVPSHLGWFNFQNLHATLYLTPHHATLNRFGEEQRFQPYNHLHEERKGLHHSDSLNSHAKVHQSPTSKHFQL